MSAKEKKNSWILYAIIHRVTIFRNDTPCSFYRHNDIFRRSEHDETYLFVSFIRRTYFSQANGVQLISFN